MESDENSTELIAQVILITLGNIKLFMLRFWNSTEI